MAGRDRNTKNVNFKKLVTLFHLKSNVLKFVRDPDSQSYYICLKSLESLVDCYDAEACNIKKTKNIERQMSQHAFGKVIDDEQVQGVRNMLKKVLPAPLPHTAYEFHSIYCFPRNKDVNKTGENYIKYRKKGQDLIAFLEGVIERHDPDGEQLENELKHSINIDIEKMNGAVTRSPTPKPTVELTVGMEVLVKGKRITLSDTHLDLLSGIGDAIKPQTSKVQIRPKNASIQNSEPVTLKSLYKPRHTIKESESVRPRRTIHFATGSRILSGNQPTQLITSNEVFSSPQSVSPRNNSPESPSPKRLARKRPTIDVADSKPRQTIKDSKSVRQLEDLQQLRGQKASDSARNTREKSLKASPSRIRPSVRKLDISNLDVPAPVKRTKHSPMDILTQVAEHHRLNDTVDLMTPGFTQASLRALKITPGFTDRITQADLERITAGQRLITPELSDLRPTRAELENRISAEQLITPKLSDRIAPAKLDRINASRLITPKFNDLITPSQLERINAERLITPKFTDRITPSQLGRIVSPQQALLVLNRAGGQLTSPVIQLVDLSRTHNVLQFETRRRSDEDTILTPQTQSFQQLCRQNPLLYPSKRTDYDDDDRA